MSGNTVNLKIDGNKVVYSGINSYSKKIDSSLSDIKLTSSSSNGYYYFKISGTNIFVDDNYDMNIFVYNECRWFFMKTLGFIKPWVTKSEGINNSTKYFNV